MTLWSALRSIGTRLLGRFTRHDEREFLPAALEVVETPPSPTGRLMGLIIVVVFVSTVAWACLGKVDVIATAPGRILPAGDVKVIQPLDPGVVRAIHVQDGDRVRAGQLLVELDPTQTGADRERASKALAQAQLDIARLTALKTAAETRMQPRFVAPPGAAPDAVAEARAATLAQSDQLKAKLADLTQQIDQKDAEAAEVAAQIAKINASLPMLTEKEQIHRRLQQQGYGTSLSLIDARQQLSEAQHELDVQFERMAQARAARSALERQREGARSQFVAEVFGDLRKAEEQNAELTQDLVKAQNKSTQTELRSPIDGVVEQMSVHSLRGVVTPAEHLMIVVPEAHDLVVEARLPNRDVGFVHAGQRVKVKVETFNFTRYGLLEGRVTDVSRDVVTEGEPRNTDRSAAATSGSQAQNYLARIKLEQTSMIIDGRREFLQPGMSIIAEIKTGDRSIIDYILSPITRKAHESLHER